MMSPPERICRPSSTETGICGAKQSAPAKLSARIDLVCVTGAERSWYVRLALFGPRAMCNLSPQCAVERTSADACGRPSVPVHSCALPSCNARLADAIAFEPMCDSERQVFASRRRNDLHADRQRRLPRRYADDRQADEGDGLRK
jgi:hypothetical protein